MRSRVLCWIVPLTVCLALMSVSGCGESDDAGNRQSASTGNIPFDADGDGQPDGSFDGQCLQVCTIEGSNQAPVILPENDGQNDPSKPAPPPPQGDPSQDPDKDPGQGPSDPNFMPPEPPPPPQPGDDTEVMVCKKFCAPNPGCMLVCSTGPGAPACKFDCADVPPPPPPCGGTCDEQCLQDAVKQGMSKEEAMKQCCQGDGNCPPPPPPCKKQCDQQCIQDVLSQGVSKEEAYQKCCQEDCEPQPCPDGDPSCCADGNCPPPPPPCEKQCDQQCIQDHLSQGMDEDKVKELCCFETCEPPQPPPPPCGNTCDEQCVQGAMQQGLSKEEAYQLCCQQADPNCQPPTPPMPDDCKQKCESQCADGDQDKCGQCLQNCIQ